FAFERTGGDAGDDYALVVLNTNARKPSETANGGMTMIVGKPGAMLVDVLDPLMASYSADAAGALHLTVPAQRAMILIPSDKVVTNL
ncbi:MAG: alpha-amylase, partial [Polyangiaceae bacterium]